MDTNPKSPKGSRVYVVDDKLIEVFPDGQSEPRVCITITDIANWIQVLQFISKDSEAA